MEYFRTGMIVDVKMSCTSCLFSCECWLEEMNPLACENSTVQTLVERQMISDWLILIFARRLIPNWLLPTRLRLTVSDARRSHFREVWHSWSPGMLYLDSFSMIPALDCTTWAFPDMLPVKNCVHFDSSTTIIPLMPGKNKKNRNEPSFDFLALRGSALEKKVSKVWAYSDTLSIWTFLLMVAQRCHQSVRISEQRPSRCISSRSICTSIEIDGSL